jgi:hypothetical protein
VAAHAANLEDELRKEVAVGHPLHLLRIRAIAQRSDTDDVLFEVSSPHFRYAVVHLTWSGEPQRDPRSPDTETFPTFANWVKSRMKPDSEQYRNR